MLWPSPHRRYRDRLSAYIDGELAYGERQALEQHLASCPACRRHLDQLRATVQALRDLPQRDVPRSFALTPQQIERPADWRPAPRLPAGRRGLPLAMPLAAGALAFALAVVLLVDLGDLGAGGGGAMPTQQAPAEIQMEQAAPFDADRARAEPQQGQSQLAPTGGQTGAGGAAGGPGAPATGGQVIASPEPSGVQSNQAEGPPQPTAPGETTDRRQPSELPSPAAPPPLPAEGGGLDSLRAAEIALAAALGLLVAGSLALAFARRKR